MRIVLNMKDPPGERVEFILDEWGTLTVYRPSDDVTLHFSANDTRELAGALFNATTVAVLRRLVPAIEAIRDEMFASRSQSPEPPK